jgi:DNA-binding GntR family transcriptional regulator
MKSEVGKMANDDFSARHAVHDLTQLERAPKSGTKLTHASMVRHALENDIFTGRLAPGSPIDEKAIAERFEVSRTPVREALLHLVESGLIEKSSRRGATVAKLDLRRLIQAFETVSELEALCARFAARRITADEKDALIKVHESASRALASGNEDEYARMGRQFHTRIMHATHNGMLIETTERLALHTLPYRRFQLRQAGRSAANQRDHDRILAAIVGGDDVKAGDLMRSHVTVQGDVLAEYISMADATTTE